MIEVLVWFVPGLVLEETLELFSPFPVGPGIGAIVPRPVVTVPFILGKAIVLA